MPFELILLEKLFFIIQNQNRTPKSTAMVWVSLGHEKVRKRDFTECRVVGDSAH